jgi:hypothetical protein
MKTESMKSNRAVPSVSLEELQTMSKSIAESKMFGVATEAQALALMLLCQAEGLHPVLALRRYHIIDGKPSMRADALQGEFEQVGSILWHERTEKECSATFFREKKQCTDAAVKRAKTRYKAMKAGEPTADLSEPGELTIIRTIDDAVDKKVALSWKDNKWVMKHNWRQSPRQMLHARCLSEGVRAIAPGLIAGVYTEDEISDMVPDDPDAVATDRQEEREQQAAEAGDKEAAPLQIIDGKEITAENYSELASHIGIAQGNMLGCKVGEMKPEMLTWLDTHYGKGEGKRWGNPPSDKDIKLKQAVEIALAKLAEEGRGHE